MDMQSTLTHEGDLMIVKSVQDVQPILDSCKNRIDAGATGSKDIKHAASFPMVVIEAYMNRMNITFQEFLRDKSHVKAMLNDKSLQGFRIWQGAV